MASAPATMFLLARAIATLTEALKGLGTTSGAAVCARPSGALAATIAARAALRAIDMLTLASFIAISMKSDYLVRLPTTYVSQQSVSIRRQSVSNNGYDRSRGKVTLE